MATNQKRIRKIFVLILVVITLGIIAFIAFYGNPVERSSFECREADGTVHTEESLFGCGWFDWKYCAKGSYVENTCTELED